jgi:hypothetical protein
MELNSMGIIMNHKKISRIMKKYNLKTKIEKGIHIKILLKKQKNIEPLKIY